MTVKRIRRRVDSRETTRLRTRLAEAEQTLRAIRSGEVDAVVVAGAAGPRVFTLVGAEHVYRMLIESMNEGALTLSGRGIVVYANRCFARMTGCPLERLIGGPFDRFLSVEDLATFRALLRRPGRSGRKVQVLLDSGGTSRTPVQISVRRLSEAGSKGATIGVVVTDMTQARHDEEVLRSLFHRLAHAQESERGRVALELHDQITQLLCAVLIRSQSLADSISHRDAKAKAEATLLRKMLGHTADEVERISRGLRPSVLDQLGLVAVLRSASKEFTGRTGVPVELGRLELGVRLPPQTELALFRILEEALRNVEQHACARLVTVAMTRRGAFVELSVTDDGVGFDAGLVSPARKPPRGLGLLGMGERAAHVDGTFKVESSPGEGTSVRVRVPLGEAG